MQSDNNKQISDSHIQQFRNMDPHVSSGGVWSKVHLRNFMKAQQFNVIRVGKET